MLDTMHSVLVKLMVLVQFVVIHNVEPQSFHANSYFHYLCQFYGCI